LKLDSSIQAGGFATALSAPGDSGVARVTRGSCFPAPVHCLTEMPAGGRTGRRIGFSSRGSTIVAPGTSMSVVIRRNWG
jgi:hypothetical protein